jgi:N-methylhydantoinase A
VVVSVTTSPERSAAILAVDVGGTFTDLVRWDGQALTTAKEPSTPADQSEGVVRGTSSLEAADRFLHGTTVATNALLEGRTARTALVTSPGFGDLVEIGRQDRPSLYDTFADRPDPIVPRDLRFGVGDDDPVPAGLAGAEAVAVSLLYGFAHPDLERNIAARIGAAHPDVAVSLSSEVVAEFREYERTITTVVNAALTPETGRYLRRLVERSRQAGLPEDVLVMRSSGGLIPIAEASRLPAAILLSGPAGGVMAAAALGEAMERRRLVSFDMGGTSTDVCRIEEGRPDVSYERAVARYACRMPSVAVHTVGAGGGSIAWADAGGALRVGPQSAGADPGPAAYARGGTRPTVTDANVLMGRIAPDVALGGNLRIDPTLAELAVGRLGGQFGLSPADAAQGITLVVEEVMAAAIRKVSLEEGSDPREATLVAYGGAGGLHATALARRLGMASVVVPLHAGVFSALGLLVSPPRVDAARSVLVTGDVADRLASEVVHVAADAERRLTDDTGRSPDAVQRIVDVRYVGQSHEVSVPYETGMAWDDVAGRFHDLHRRRNGFARSEDPIEVVTVRAEAVGAPALAFGDVPVPEPEGSATAGHRTVIGSGGPVEATIVRRTGLAPGDEIVGPAVIEEREATTFLDSGERATVHQTGAIEVEW